MVSDALKQELIDDHNRYQALKKRWVDALRSGKYLQTFKIMKETTEEGDKYCAYGVLLAILKEGESSSKEALELCRINRTRLIVHMNDEEHKSFLEIADWIEVNL